MEKELKIWHVFIAAASLLITIIGVIVVFSNKVQTQSIEIQYLKSGYQDHGLMLKNLNQDQEHQYREINSKLTDILIRLETKQNKK